MKETSPILTSAEDPISPASALLGRMGFQSALLYLIFVLPTFLVSLYCIKTGGSFSTLFEETWRLSFLQGGTLSPGLLKILGDGLVILLTAGVTYLYWQGYQAMASLKELSPEAESKLVRQILFWTLIFSLLLLWVAPFHSRDLYGYINRGAQQALYGTNPYVTPIAQIPGWQQEPMFHAHWIDNPSPYGFFFTALTKILVTLSGPHFALAVGLFKGLNVLVHLATAWCIYQFGKQLQLARPWLGAYLYAWSPLMLLHTIGNGHNDILLAVTLLLSLWSLSSKRTAWLSLPLLVLSILTKYAPLLAAPFIGLYLLRQRDWKNIAIGVSLSLGLALLLAWPYVGDLHTFALGAMEKNAGMSQHSLHSMLYRSLFYTAKLLPGLHSLLEPFRALLKVALWGSFGLFYLWMLSRFAKHPHPRMFPALLAKVTGVLVVMITLVSPKFNVWYIGMFFPLLFLLPEECRIRRFGLLLSLVQLLAFTPLENLHILNYALLTLLPFWWVYGKRPQQEAKRAA